jgi:Ca2+-binding RTX toxin-like protein
MASFTGTAGNDTQNGTSSDDTFDYQQGGRDTLNGKGGNDLFDMGVELRASDRIDGGAGLDFVHIGDAVTPFSVAFDSNTLSNVEFVQIDNPGVYSITFADGNIAAGGHMSVLSSAASQVFVDGSAESDGSFTMDTSPGDDVLFGGAQADALTGGSTFFDAGLDRVEGNGGNDQINFWDDLTSADRAQGGAGFDLLYLTGDYSGGLALGSKTVRGIDEIDLALFGGGDSYWISFHEATVAAGNVMAVDANDAASVTLDASADTDGTYYLNGSAGADVLLGGGGDDSISGAGGVDFLRGDSGADEFRFQEAAHSTGPNYDVLDGFNANADTIRVVPAVSGVDAKVNSGTLNVATFDADLAARIGAGKLGANHAVLYKPSAGDLAGVMFLVVDLNGTAGYQAAADLVVRLDAGANLNNLDVTDFTQF